jgi:predicted DNA-binding protein with PD1-like motif
MTDSNETKRHVRTNQGYLMVLRQGDDVVLRQGDDVFVRNVEIGSLVGSLAWKDGVPSPHLHGVACDDTFAAYGGHLLSLEVSTGSMELTLVVHPHRLERVTDECTGANILHLP